jgi:hypothetical protein
LYYLKNSALLILNSYGVCNSVLNVKLKAKATAGFDVGVGVFESCKTPYSYRKKKVGVLTLT